MELFPAEAETLRKIVQEWTEHSERELEATFGPGGEVDSTAFLNVAKRLRAKGFANLQQEDRLTITLPDHTRFTLIGSGVIQQYCRDNRLAGKNFVAMIKDRAGAESNLDLDDYVTRLKVRREIEMLPVDSRVAAILATWPQQKKAFRLIRRWSFRGAGVQFDLSMVRSTKKDLKGNYVWVRNFTDQDISQEAPHYEVEVELVRDTSTESPEKATVALIRGVGEVLRGLQKNTLLIRKSVQEKVLGAYSTLVGGNRFRGVAPITLQLQNMTAQREAGVPNIRDGFNVTDKADGLRVMGFCDSKGELFLIDMSLTVYRTGLRKEACKNSLLDGEWVTMTKENKPVQMLCLFDIYIAPDSRKVDNLPFYLHEEDKPTRYKALRDWLTAWTKDGGPKVIVAGLTPTTQLQISMKDFEFAVKGETDIFRKAAEVLRRPKIYHTDGLIFTANGVPLPGSFGGKFDEQLKWKPAMDNTVDFLAITQKVVDQPKVDLITSGIRADTGEVVVYKTLHLFVGSSEVNPMDTVLFERKDSNVGPGGGRHDRYRPVPFTPKDFPDPMASICYLPVETDPDTNEEYMRTERSQEPIQDRSILEMRYDPAQPPGWRWIPLRVRYDKTERFEKGILRKTLNSDINAEGVWNSIHEPVTESMLMTGAEQPSEAELAAMTSVQREGREELAGKRYYERKAPKEDLAIIRGLRDFHNRWVKEEILLRVGLKGGGKSLLDTAVGRAADIHRWNHAQVGFVLGVDIAGDGITNARDGAYSRYLNIRQQRRGQIAPMIFVTADSSKPLVNGDAAASEKDADILRAVFGRVKPLGPVPPYVQRVGAKKLEDGADCVACMFALHYFFKDKDTFEGYLNNLRDTLRVGGYFVACFFDGQAVFDLLEPLAPGESRVGIEDGSEVWKITKQYSDDVLPTDDSGFGLAIDVEFMSIGTSHTEYLVPFPLLQEKMRTIGCELLTPEELAQVGMKNSTAMFATSYEMATKAGRRYPMTDVVKQYSFLNRWCIFKRKGATPLEAASLPPAAAAASAVGNNQPLSVFNVREPNTALLSAAPPAGAAAAATAAGPAMGDAVATALARQPSTIAAPVSADKSYEEGDIFRFYLEAPEVEKPQPGEFDFDKRMKEYTKALKKALAEDTGGARWLAPGAPFPIVDPANNRVKYPTLEHFLAGMRYKVASDQPQLSESLFGEEGTIHQKYLREEQALRSASRGILSNEKLQELLVREIAEVREHVKPAAFRKYRATYDEATWMSRRDEILRIGLSQRYDRDERMRRIVLDGKQKGKYLLHYVASGVSDLGGYRDSKTGQIRGENKVGRLLMELSAYPGVTGSSAATGSPGAAAAAASAAAVVPPATAVQPSVTRQAGGTRKLAKKTT